MSNLSFTRQDIDDLARKLTKNQQLLTKPEQQLLLAIFAAAGQNVQRAAAGVTPAAQAPDSGQVTAQELQQQLLRSFTPGTQSAEAQPLKIVGV